MFTRTIIDIYHGDNADIPLLANNGVVAVMLKATQGSTYVDLTYAPRVGQARDQGLLVGSYHFADGSDPVEQVAHWLDVAMPKTGEVLELDWEDNGQNSMSYAQACEMVAEIFRRTGRFPLLYGSNFLREKIPATGDSILFKCPLSLASYTGSVKPPRGWDKYTLWQYTGDNQNAHISPHWFPGASGPLDVYQYDGTIADLRAKWPFANPTP